MITASKTISALTISQGDTVVFDFSAWEDEFGKGTLQLWHRPHGAFVAHMVELSVYHGQVVWTVTSEDTAAVGMGKGLLVYNAVSGAVTKSDIFDIIVPA